MAKSLKVLLYIYGIILILSGLGLIFLPDQMAAIWGASGISSFARFAEGVTGATFLTAGIWLFVVARDPLSNINWVKFVITKAALFIVIVIYSIIVGYIALSDSLPVLILEVIMLALFLIFYPWCRASRAG